MALTLAHTPRAVAAPTGPPPNLLYQLRQQNRARPWWHVTTDSGRIEVRIVRIDDAGLDGLEPARGGARVPSHIGWASVARLDEITTGAHRGRLLGGIAGTVVGAGIANMVWPDESASLVLEGGSLLGWAGAFAGGRYGQRHRHDRLWYERGPAELAAGTQLAADSAGAGITPVAGSEPASTPADTSRAGGAAIADPVGAPAPTAPDLPTPPDVLRACARVGSGDLLRVNGAFGELQGRASIVGPQGIEGLIASSRRAPPAPKLLTWSEINSVDKRAGSSLHGALIGAALVGGLGLVVGLAVVAVTQSDTAGSAPVELGFGGAAIGAGLGALLGTPIPRWSNVYLRR